jgi:hypothetical protein
MHDDDRYAAAARRRIGSSLLPGAALTQCTDLRCKSWTWQNGFMRWCSVHAKRDGTGNTGIPEATLH